VTICKVLKKDGYDRGLARSLFCSPLYVANLEGGFVKGMEDLGDNKGLQSVSLTHPFSVKYGYFLENTPTSAVLYPCRAAYPGS